MTLQPPNLDDRYFADIFTELRERIPHYCPEWTEYHDSDPGITLMQLFAAMTEQLLYRMNQMPRQHYIRFLKLLGIELEGPKAAQTDVTFWFSEAQPGITRIEEGTEISTTQTEDTIPVIFSTTETFEIKIPHLAMLLTAQSEIIQDEPRGHPKKVGALDALLPTSRANTSIDRRIFADTDNGGAFLFGFSTNVSRYLLRISVVTDLNSTDAADGLDPDRPPWIWEACVIDEVEEEQDRIGSKKEKQGKWIKCKLEQDTSGGMSRSGHIDVHLPAEMLRTSITDRGAEDRLPYYWLRVRLIDQSSTSEYRTSPRLNRVDSVEALGCTISAEHSRVIENEVVGHSDGTPGQRFYLAHTPVLPRPNKLNHNECLFAVANESGDPEKWIEVSDFAESAIEPLPPHYTLDNLTGEIRLGPAIRLPDGTIREHGAYPPAQTEVRFAKYRSGGGIEGNVQKGELNTLKTSIPYVKRVLNHSAATGGANAQDIEEALLIAPNRLRSRERAVALEDFEYLTMSEFSGKFGRAKCLPVKLGDLPRTTQQIEQLKKKNNAPEIVVPTIELRVIPYIKDEAGPIEPNKLLDLPASSVDLLKNFLDERRLLCTQLSIGLPRYHWVATRVTIRPVAGASVHEIERKVLHRLYQFLNPLCGGLDRKGWPFGHDLQNWEIFQCLMQGSPSDPYADDELDVTLFRVLHIQIFQRDKGKQEKNNDKDAEVDLDTQKLEERRHINVAPDGVIASLRHQIVIAKS